jgi:hypothetical protein
VWQNRHERDVEQRGAIVLRTSGARNACVRLAPVQPQAAVSGTLRPFCLRTIASEISSDCS